MTKTSLNLPSFAKINRLLRILGKRPDGYHEILTVLQTVSLCDELTFDLREDGKLTLLCDDPHVPTDSTNLIIKAGLALQESLHSPLGADIKLVKKIPVQGGLGGASSNAAVTLIALNGLWQGTLKPGDLEQMSMDLGADVPFFTVGGRCVATGIGTSLLALQEGPQQFLIIISPVARVATPEAYRSLNAGSLTTIDAMPILSSSFERLFTGDSNQWHPLDNDFERVIFEIEPEIGRAKMALLEAGAQGALLAGSGSSVFGVFDDEAARNRALGNLKSEAGWKVFSCHTLSREEYMSAMNPAGYPLFTLSKTATDKTDTGA